VVLQMSMRRCRLKHIRLFEGRRIKCKHIQLCPDPETVKVIEETGSYPNPSRSGHFDFYTAHIMMPYLGTG
jgi:hypothetical protein